MFVLAVSLLLTGCGNKVKSNDEVIVDEEREDEIETVFEKDTDITLIDNEDMKVNLLKVAQGRSDQTDHVSLKVEIENKQSKTFEFYLKELKVDGKEIDSTHLWIDDEEVKPEEVISTFINGYEDEELTLGEHVAGKIIYNDYDDNRNEIEFSEYINE